MSQFYEIDSTKVSLREYWWGTKSPAIIIAWIIKWLRIRIPSSSDDPNTESTPPFVVEALPPEIAAGFEPLTQELARFGFVDPVCYVIHDPGTRTTIYWAVFRHEAGQYFARIHQRFWHQSQKHDRGMFLMFFTAFPDGTFLVSSSGKPDMAAPGTVRMNRMFKATVVRLWDKHQELTAESPQEFVQPVRSREDLVALTEQHHVLVRDFHLARGVFRPRTVVEQAAAETFATDVATAQAGGLQYPEVLAELKKLQEKKTGWAAAGWMLVISFVLFAVLGAARWNWQFTLLIIPVLFFHECGHWVAMRIFKYRNLRMFFIPLFGAAVIGRNSNVPGWKKALVSLAGPLPGIALGILIGVIGLLLKKPLVDEFALLLVFINGLNLLPVLPLDGGHVLQTILFCRHRWLNVAFQITAAIGLFLLSLAGMGKIFMYLAIVMAVSLPVLIKLGGVTDKLRGSLPPPPPGSDDISPAAAAAIITEVKAAFPKITGSKAIAQHTLNVYETLNARPPGALATIGLLTLHGGAFLLAIVFSLLLFVGKYGGGLGDFARAAMRQPQLTYHCGDTQQWRGADAGFKSRNVIVAAFKKHDLAAAEFKTLTAELPPASRLTLFGETLMLTLPVNDDTAREKWFDRLQTATTNLFVMVSNQPAMVNITFIAPNMRAATNLVIDLNGYLQAGAGLHLIAPWSPAAHKPEFAAFRYARQEWQQIDLVSGKATEDNLELESYFKKISSARKRGAQAEVGRLEEERSQLMQKLQAAACDRLAATATNPVVGVLVGLHAELARLNYTNRVELAALQRNISANLGEVAYDGDKPDPAADATGATMGMASQHGLMVETTWLLLNDASVSLPELANWLCEQGCAGIKYDLSAGFGGADEE
jgi:Zn-dependent protease